MFKKKEYIYTVYKEGSFSKAADILHISQPALSAEIKRVEDSLGSQIFNRRTKPITVTEFGLEYIHSIEKINEIETHINELSNKIQDMESGSLSIGGSSLNLSYIITQNIARFKKMYPGIDLSVHDTSTMEAKKLLDEGKLDLIITNRPFDPSKYARTRCYEERLLWVIPKDYKVNDLIREKRLGSHEIGDMVFNLDKEKAVSSDVFKDTPFILLTESNYMRSCANNIFHEHNTEAIVTLEVETVPIAFNFAAMGVGATLISNRLISDSDYYKDLNYYLIDSSYDYREAFIYYSKGRFLTLAMQRFIDMFK